MSKRALSGRLPAVVLIMVLAGWNLVPVVGMLSTSLKTTPDIHRIPARMFPRKVVLDNYRRVLGNPVMVRSFMNSVIVAGSAAIVSVVLGSLAGYGFARYRFRGRKLLLSYVLYSTVLPRAIIIIPLYLLLRRMHLAGGHFGLVFAYLLIGLPLSMWMFTAFIRTVPHELDEAARIDGCNGGMILFKIVFPIVKPCILATFLYSFVLSWNEYLLPLVLTTPKTTPATVALVAYVGEIATDWGAVMSAAFLMTIPAVVVFLALEKYLVSGLAAGALK